MFGEPWSASETPMEQEALPALKKNIDRLNPQVGFFCDDTRDAIKGHTFEGGTPGFVNGGKGQEGAILSSVKAWCGPGSKVQAPSQVVTYVSAHDNWTLWDKLSLTVEDEAERMRANRMAAAVYMTCRAGFSSFPGKKRPATKGGLEIPTTLRLRSTVSNWNRMYEQYDW